MTRNWQANGPEWTAFERELFKACGVRDEVLLSRNPKAPYEEAIFSLFRGGISVWSSPERDALIVYLANLYATEPLGRQEILAEMEAVYWKASTPPSETGGE